MTSDDKNYLYLTVSADPAVSVINSKVSSASDHENDVIYSSVTTTTKKKTLFQAVRDDEVIYSSVVLK
ncbi:hypothetical protein SRHO_G00239020 [Serrasalmus rhombeus]